MIEIKNLSFRYGDHKALDGINLEIREGEWVAVMGAERFARPVSEVTA